MGELGEDPDMISFEQAISIIEQARFVQRESVEVSVRSAFGKVNAHDVRSSLRNPPFNNSAMDGYAVQVKDLEGASESAPASLTVVGSMSAGDHFPSLTAQPGEAIEIMTGAPLPAGCDAVVKVEDVVISPDKDSIQIGRSCVLGENIREAGSDFEVGDILVQAGAVLQSQHIMGLLAAGIASVSVRRPAKVAVISTGAEIVETISGGGGQGVKVKSLEPGQIYNSTAPFLVTSLERFGVDVHYGGIVPDAPEVFDELVKGYLSEEFDLILSTGGVSMGKHDFVPASVRDLGGEVLFHKVAIRPGKPVLYAQFKQDTRFTGFFGLPGNPLSVLCNFRIFVVPYLYRLLGLEPEKTIKATISRDTKKPQALRKFVLGNVRWEKSGAVFEPHEPQLSYMLNPTFHSNGWATLREGQGVVCAGEEVEVLLFHPFNSFV
jgi:molybdopterin molybdotransferase